MSIRQRLHELLGAEQNPTPFIQIHPDLLPTIEDIAHQENSSLEVVINDLLHFALSEHQQAEDSLLVWRQLTPREREITALIWLGLTNPQISQDLSISPNTVKTHIKNILSKFNIHSKETLREKLAMLDFSDWVDM